MKPDPSAPKPTWKRVLLFLGILTEKPPWPRRLREWWLRRQAEREVAARRRHSKDRRRTRTAEHGRIIDGERWIGERLTFLRERLAAGLTEEERSAVQAEIEVPSKERGMSLGGRSQLSSCCSFTVS